METTTQRVELEIEIHAPVDRVWKALVDDTTFWWPRDFYTSSKTKGFYFEQRLGGKLYEDWGNNSGVIWYEVFAFDPPHSLDLRGYLAVPFGPALSLLHLELETSKVGTILKISDSIFGASTDDGKSKLEGWKQIFEFGLKQFLENEQPRTSHN